MLISKILQFLDKPFMLSTETNQIRLIRLYRTTQLQYPLPILLNQLIQLRYRILQEPLLLSYHFLRLSHPRIFFPQHLHCLLLVLLICLVIPIFPIQIRQQLIILYLCLS